MNRATKYRGRLAPSPTGYMHLGHARTFWIAQERARAGGGALILRSEDLDVSRCKPEFADAMLEDLRWFGCGWTEGPDLGGKFGSYRQSQRLDLYRDAFERLRSTNTLYPCVCSRKDIQAAVTAPHAADDEIIYPGTCRSRPAISNAAPFAPSTTASDAHRLPPPAWRFRVPDGEVISFVDGHFGPQKFVAGRDFGDFVVWRGDGVPAYQLACVVDDAAMQITEVVRGQDLLVSTARQLLLYHALGFTPPVFFHCELLRDEAGQRLAKRHDTLSLRHLREQVVSPAELRKNWTF